MSIKSFFAALGIVFAAFAVTGCATVPEEGAEPREEREDRERRRPTSF